MKLGPILMQWLVPIAIPIVIAVLKMLVDNLGNINIPKPLIPVAAALIGAAITMLEGMVTGTGAAANVATVSSGALLGLSGVGIREIWNQFRKFLAGNN